MKNAKIVDLGDKDQDEDFHLKRKLKLLTSDNFTFVFSQAQRFGNKSLTVLARENNLDHPRLGLAISKKCAKHAVDRNRIKRIFRESFRLHQHNLPSVDIIAMCKPSVLTLDKSQLHMQIEAQWHFIRKKFFISTSTKKS